MRVTLLTGMCCAFLLALGGCEGDALDPGFEPELPSQLGEIAAALSSEIPSWDSSLQYDSGALIQFEGDIYETVSNVGVESNPMDNPEEWRVASVENVESFLVTSSALGTDEQFSSLEVAAANRGIVWLGQWSKGQVYEAGEVVAYQGQAYIATSSTSGLEEPVDDNFWDLLASRGERGASGVQGEAGSAGATGPKGDAGDVGPAGPIGPQGFTGLSGAKGDTGDTGPAGAKGDAGDTGPAGAKGDAGDAGPAGAKGDAGDAGPAGAKGDTGDTGPAGARGDTGDTGPAGVKGDTGDTGPAGAKGDTGDTGPAGAKGDTGDTGPAGVKGDTGDAGPAGAKGDAGDAGPAGAKGDTGDAGPAGAKGDTGDAGPAGAKGDTGDAGASGAKGDAGDAGIAGVKGDTGDAGSAGVKGDTGDAGLAGAKGDTGDTGPAGARGDTGDTGPAGADGDAGLHWQGAWSAVTAYELNDAVSYSGSAYIAIQAPTAGILPTDGSYWDVLAAGGADGADGTSGGSGSSAGNRYVVAGITSGVFNGAAGFRAMNQACETDFGTSARMATSLDVARFPLTTGTSGMHWVQGIAHPSNIAIDNTTGLDLSSSASSLNCSSWSSTSGNGLAIHGNNFSFNLYASCANSLSVLCAVASGTEEEYEFSGFTSTTMSGNGGYVAMTAACQSDFGSDARVASTTEISQSNLGTAQSGVAWVQGTPHASSAALDAVSGISTGSAGSLTCRGWSNSGSILGLIVDGSTFSMGTQYCYQQAAVACAVPD